MKTRQHNIWVIAGLLASATIIASCSKSDNTASLPSIGGYNSSNDVASANLIAHWTFDGTNNEDISKTAPSKAANAAFTTGIKNQALQLSAGYLLYPTISALNSASALGSFTLSAWVNTSNNGSTSSSIFALSSPTATDWGQMINFLIETNQKKATSDSLIVHGILGQYATGQRSGQDNVNSGDLADAGNTFKIVKGAAKWTHVAFKYDGSSSNIDIYANGIVVSNSKYRQRGTLGQLVFSTPTQVLIGGWPNIATGFPGSPNQTFQGLFVGGIDEVRVYNKALSDTDVSAIYNLEVVGR